MPKGRRRLTYEERCRIPALKGSGRSNGKTARQLGRDPSSICREIRRNVGEGATLTRQTRIYQSNALESVSFSHSDSFPSQSCMARDAALLSALLVSEPAAPSSSRTSAHLITDSSLHGTSARRGLPVRRRTAVRTADRGENRRDRVGAV